MVFVTYNIGTRDLPDIYAHTLRPVALGLGHIYQANPLCPCYNYYIYHLDTLDQRDLPVYISHIRIPVPRIYHGISLFPGIYHDIFSGIYMRNIYWQVPLI